MLCRSLLRKVLELQSRRSERIERQHHHNVAFATFRVRVDLHEDTELLLHTMDSVEQHVHCFFVADRVGLAPSPLVVSTIDSTCYIN